MPGSATGGMGGMSYAHHALTWSTRASSACLIPRNRSILTLKRTVANECIFISFAKDIRRADKAPRGAHLVASERFQCPYGCDLAGPAALQT